MWNVIYDTDIVLYRATLYPKWDDTSDTNTRILYNDDIQFYMKSTHHDDR